MNVQFAVKDGEVYLIEVNPRASRTVPFIAKAIGMPIAKIAARVMAGESCSRTCRPIDRDDRPYRGQGERCSRSRASRGPTRCSDRK